MAERSYIFRVSLTWDSGFSAKVTYVSPTISLDNSLTLHVESDTTVNALQEAIASVPVAAGVVFTDISITVVDQLCKDVVMTYTST